MKKAKNTATSAFEWTTKHDDLYSMPTIFILSPEQKYNNVSLFSIQYTFIGLDNDMFFCEKQRDR